MVVSKQFKNNLSYNTDQVCFAKTVSPAPIFVGFRDPTIRVLGFASYHGLGTWDPYSYWGRWHSMATHIQSVNLLGYATPFCHKIIKCADYWIQGKMFVRQIIPGIKLEHFHSSISLLTHGGVIAWKRFPYTWPFVWGNHWSLVNSTGDYHTEGPWCYTLIISFLLSWASWLDI